MSNFQGGRRIPWFQIEEESKAKISLSWEVVQISSGWHFRLAVLSFQGTANALIGVLLNSCLLPKGRGTNNALPVVLASRGLGKKWGRPVLELFNSALSVERGEKGVTSSTKTANAYYSSGSTYTHRLETGHKKQQIALRKEWIPVERGGRCLA